MCPSRRHRTTRDDGEVQSADPFPSLLGKVGMGFPYWRNSVYARVSLVREG